MSGEDITSSVYSNGSINIENVTGNIEIIATAATSEFGANSWSTIVSNIQNGNTSMYNVGDTKTIDLGTLGKHIVRIANKSNDDEVCTEEKFKDENEVEHTYSKTACGFVIEFVNVLIGRRMNLRNINTGGWPASEMRTYLNNDIYNSFPEDLKAGIINTIVVAGPEIGINQNYISTDKLYLLSSIEVFGITYTYDKIINETRQLDYYKEKDPVKNRNLATKTFNNGIKEWFLRSAYNDSGNNHYFVCVLYSGILGGCHAANPYGISPAFRIG